MHQGKNYLKAKKINERKNDISNQTPCKVNRYIIFNGRKPKKRENLKSSSGGRRPSYLQRNKDKDYSALLIRIYESKNKVKYLNC